MSHHSPPGTYTWPAHREPAPPEPRTETPGRGDGFLYLRLPRQACCRTWRVATLAVFGFFVLFLLLAAGAPGFMARTAADGMPVGLLLALLQFPVLLVAALGCKHSSHRHEDLAADGLPEEEGEAAPWRGVL
ncbi:DUF485 domain-containing protein [Streptomyces sp. NPDC001288]|uniref:DUF485 domain-containing protein n=1 Tax=unclassified Streptomyces TaxID=2593676 RepID=UPI0033211049